MDTAPSQLLHFDGFSVDLMRCALLRGNEEVRLRPKAFDVLSYLARRPDRVVSKEELIAAVWAGVFVTDDALVQCIRAIRGALRDEARSLVKTIPRRGYLFAGKALAMPATGRIRVPGTGDLRPTAPPQEVTFCRTGDGVPIAVAQSGRGTAVAVRGAGTAGIT